MRDYSFFMLKKSILKAPLVFGTILKNTFREGEKEKTLIENQHKANEQNDSFEMR